MPGGKIYITRILPSNVWDALLGANAPSAANVFATIADLAGAVTLYTGNGVVGTGRQATITDTLSFIATAGNSVGIGPTAHVPVGILDVRANDTRGSRFVGNSAVVGTSLAIYNSTPSALAVFPNAGDMLIAPIVGHNLTIGPIAGTAKLTVTGNGATSATINVLLRNSTPTNLFQLNDDGNASIGTVAPTATNRLLITGSGATIATLAQQWQNSTPSILMTLNNAGQLGVNTVDWTSGVGGITDKFCVRGSNGDTGYHSLTTFENTLTPTVNNGNNNRTLTASTLKFGAFNTQEIVAQYCSADNLGGGNVSEFNGSRSFVNQRGAGAITWANSYYSDKQQADGTVTYLSSFTADMSSMTGGTATNVLGLYVKTPVNISAGTRTNTFGILIEGNTFGTNNYGFVCSGNQTHGFGTLTPNQNSLVVLTSTTKAALEITPMTAAQASAITPANGMGLYVSTTDATFLTVGFWKYEAGAWATW